MARYRKIDPRIWHDEKFRSLSIEARHVFLYLLTSPHSSACGAYIIDDLYMVADTQFTKNQVEKAVSELLANRVIIRCEQTRLVAFPNWFKYNPPVNQKSAAACINAIAELPKCKALSEYCTKSEWLKERLDNGYLTVSYPSEGEQEQEQEQEQDKEICANIDPAIEASKDGNGNGKGKPQKVGGGCFIDSNGVKYYPTKKGRKLTGWKLEAFDRFWDAFDKKTGRAAAADAWLDIKGLDEDMVEKIIAGAEKEANARPAKEAKGMTAKFPQGWLSDRRWEDEVVDFSTNNTQRRNNNGDTRTAEQIREDRLRVLSGTN